MEDKDRLQIAWQAFSMENSLLQGYRMLFMMVEAALLALAYALLVPLVRDTKEFWMIWVAAVVGWLVAIIWGVICHYKGKDVDRWRDRILGFQSITEKDWSVVGKGWFDYPKPEVPKNWFKHPSLWFKSLRVQFQGGAIARYIFNYIIPAVVVGLWILMVVLL